MLVDWNEAGRRIGCFYDKSNAFFYAASCFIVFNGVYRENLNGACFYTGRDVTLIKASSAHVTTKNFVFLFDILRMCIRERICTRLATNAQLMILNNNTVFALRRSAGRTYCHACRIFAVIASGSDPRTLRLMLET